MRLWSKINKRRSIRNFFSNELNQFKNSVMEPREWLIVVGICFLFFFGIPIRVTKNSVKEEDLFKEYIKNFNKSYNDNNAEYLVRFENFKYSLRLIEDLNRNRSSDLSALYGLNEFSDLSQSEFIRNRLQKTSNEAFEKHIRYNKCMRYNIKANSSKRERRSRAITPVKVDWREKGIVGGIHNQKTCGACWAFSVIETVESMNALKSGSLVDLSVQEVIDCARFGNYGCEGGNSCALLNWLFSTKTKITTEKFYPFTYKTGFCKVKKSSTGVQIESYSCDNFVGAEDLLQRKIALHGPVAAAVNAINWQYYLGGIIQYHCTGNPRDLNHAIQIVGYDKTGSIPFYIARNSWGSEFGDKGYVYIAMGGNLCGLANEVTSLDVL